MASFQPVGQTGAGPSSIPSEEFTVRIPKDCGRKFSLMKFGSGTAVDFAKLGDQPVKIERENNLREYKTANDLDLLPKYGAGSEYGRDQKEESRRKKYGIMLKKYNPDDQPWLLKIGSGKQAKKFKGLREGTIAENTSYYIFTKAADGAFEAFPVEEWNKFSPVIRYKYLNSDQAEEEYNRRDKTLNFFSIMVRNRMKKEEDNVDEDDPDAKKKGKKKKGAKKSKDLILTDMEEWDDLNMSDDDDDDDEDRDDDDEGGGPKKKKAKPGAKKTVKNSKKNSDDEAVEESDEGDYDDREVDYMSDSGSSDSLSGPEKENDIGKKYEEKGVDEEAGLRNILDSEAEDEEEEEEGEKEENEEETEEKVEKKEEKKKTGDNDSSSSSSEDDSDIEKDAALASEIFMQKEKKEKKDKKDKTDATGSESTEKAGNRTPTPDKMKDKGQKRKADKTPDGKTPSTKKHKSEDGNEGITEDAIRRYLMRKPMTTKDLLQKFKLKKLNMSNEKIQHVIVQLLKKINPDTTTIHKKMYLSLKKPE